VAKTLHEQLWDTEIGARIRKVEKAWFAQVYRWPRTQDGYKLAWTPPELEIFEDRVEIGADTKWSTLYKYPYIIVDGEVLF
jgi:hypothetical protein